MNTNKIDPEMIQFQFTLCTANYEIINKFELATQGSQKYGNIKSESMYKMYCKLWW